MTLFKSLWQASKVFAYLLIHPGYAAVQLQPKSEAPASIHIDERAAVGQELHLIAEELGKIAVAVDGLAGAVDRLTLHFREFEATVGALLISIPLPKSAILPATGDRIDE